MGCPWHEPEKKIMTPTHRNTFEYCKAYYPIYKKTRQFIR